MKRWVFILLGILVLASILVACGDEVAPLPSATSTITPHSVSLIQKAYLPTYQAKVTQSVVVVPAAQATQTVHALLTKAAIAQTQVVEAMNTTTPSPTTTETFDCENYVQLESFETFEDFENYLLSIQQKLDACFEIQSVANALLTSEQFSGFAEVHDLNNDSTPEFIIGGSVNFPDHGVGEPDHVVHLVTFYTLENKYSYQIFFEGWFNGSPQIEGFIDINNDGIEELVVYTAYGGTGCENFINVIGWNENKPYDFFSTIDEFMDCPAETHARDLENDGELEFIQCPRGMDCLEFVPPEASIYELKDDAYILKAFP